MSKSVRIRDHLYEEIERLAKTERRSLISQLEVLLEQALRMERQESGEAAVETPGDFPAGIDMPLESSHFKPNPKPSERKR